MAKRVFRNVRSFPVRLLKAIRGAVQERATLDKRVPRNIRSFPVRPLKAIRRAVQELTVKKTVTIDIDGNTIRLLETGGGAVRKWASLSLEPGQVEGGVVTDRRALGRIVRQLMTSSGIKAKKVIASLSGLYSVSRTVIVANPVRGAITREAVLDEAMEVMPLSEDRLYLSWQTIEIGDNGHRVLVVGVPRDVIDSEVLSLRTVGISPHLLELKAMALTRAVNREQALILNIEPSSLDIVMVVNGGAEIIRTIAWQQDDLAVEDEAEHLARTLEMTVDFYDMRNPDTPLDPATPVFITGQISDNPALGERLQARLRYPVEPLAPPLECPAHLPVSEYAVNIGLALKQTEPSKNLGQDIYFNPGINLLPDTYHAWRPSPRQIYSSLGIIAAIALIFPLYQVTTEAMDRTANLETEQAILNSELQQRMVEIQKREPLQQAINQYNSIVDMGGTFTEDLQVIKSEADKLDVEVQSIEHEADSITVDCQADSYVTFRQYITALEESGRFATVTPPKEQFSLTGGYLTGGEIELEPIPGD